MVVTSPFEGQGRHWNGQCYVLDTKTGVVCLRLDRDERMLKWDPANRTLRYDTLTVTNRKK